MVWWSLTLQAVPGQSCCQCWRTHCIICITLLSTVLPKAFGIEYSWQSILGDSRRLLVPCPKAECSTETVHGPCMACPLRLSGEFLLVGKWLVKLCEFVSIYILPPALVCECLRCLMLRLPLGSIRFREKGSSGGHKGLEGIEAGFSTQCWAESSLNTALTADKHLDMSWLYLDCKIH